MNEKDIHNLLDEALQIHIQGGDIEAFYARHEDVRSELQSLLEMPAHIGALRAVNAPESLRGKERIISSNAQQRRVFMESWFAPALLMRVAAFATLVIVIGGGYTYRQNSIRTDLLSSFDVASSERQQFIDVVGESSIALSAPAAPDAKSGVLPAPAPRETGILAAPPAEAIMVSELGGFSLLYAEQAALENLKRESPSF